MVPMETWIDIPPTDEPELESHLAPTCGFWWVDPDELASDETANPRGGDVLTTERSDIDG